MECEQEELVWVLVTEGLMLSEGERRVCSNMGQTKGYYSFQRVMA